MKKLFILIAIISVVFASSPKKYQKKLSVGINVNWCNFKYFVNKEYYKKAGVFAKMGFKHVRIRFNAKLYRENPPKMLECLINAVDYSLKNKLIPIITYIDDDLAKNPSDENIAFAIRTWNEISTTFRDYPNKLSYDLYIEPNKELGREPQKLIKLYKASIEAIRKNDRKKIIFIAPSHIANPYYLDELNTIADDKKLNKKLMIEWHFYAAGPSKTNKKKLWTTGTDYEKKLIDDKINYAYNWCKKHHMKSWVGAVMPGNYNHGDDYTYDEQINFITYLIKKLKEKNIPIAINADHQFYDYKTDSVKREEVLKAIINSSKQ
jgi:hypothetical protein